MRLLICCFLALNFFLLTHGAQKKTISDAGATALFEAMWNSDINAGEFAVKPQAKIRSWDSTADLAPKRFFSWVNETIIDKIPTYKAFVQLLDNYYRETGKAESDTSAEMVEKNRFLDLVLKSSVMKQAHKFLVKRGLSQRSTAEFKKQLMTLWFQPYRRTKGNRNRDSSGFEHVFVGETRDGEVMGLHNWVQFYREEKSGRVNYNGYKKKSCDYLYAVSFKWEHNMKPMNSLLLGTSPEFEMAMYTVAHLLLNSKQATAISTQMGPCRVQLICHPYSGGKHIGTCYPQ